ncbi:MAG: 6-phosphogluconolactonase [bacterium]|nr:6-phosphogluconolactonase [bacterium]MCP4968327.1 6-phosphogluconolactonase [bacterium]
MSVHIYPNPQDLAVAAADYIAACVAKTARQVSLGLAGGGTPAAAYRELAQRDVDWSNVVMWLGDERWVPHDHAESNTRMAHATLVDKVVGRLIAPNTAFGDPNDAAAAYAESIMEVFHDGRPDLVLLGIGDDGHTASLFPGTAALESESGVYVANWVADKDTWRLTATMTTLWQARELVFLVQGESKAAILAQILDNEHPYPAQRVAAGAVRVRWLVDEGAASQLRSVPR